MPNQKSFSIKKRIESFAFALRGMKSLILNEHNARVHFFVLFCVVILGCVLDISAQDWVAILIVSGLVIVTETINTAIERLADFVQPNWDEKIGLIKDYGAAAVLFSSIFAVIVGGLVFIPKIHSYILD